MKFQLEPTELPDGASLRANLLDFDDKLMSHPMEPMKLWMNPMLQLAYHGKRSICRLEISLDILYIICYSTVKFLHGLYLHRIHSRNLICERKHRKFNHPKRAEPDAMKAKFFVHSR